MRRAGHLRTLPGDAEHRPFAKWAIDAALDALGRPASIEVDYRGNRPLAAGNRLGCAARIVGDVVVDVPATSQVHRQVVRKDLDLAPIDVDPAFRLYYVDVPPAVLGDAVSTATALRNAVAEQHGLERPDLDGTLLPLAACPRWPPTAAASPSPSTDPSAPVAVIVAIWPGYVDTAYGLAVDVGSTTVAGHLCDLSTGEVVATAGRMNPQIRFGEDLMSRVSYVMMNPGGDRELTTAIRDALNELVGELVAAADVARDRVLEVVLVGNPIMHHIVLGIDPTPLGSAPFTLATDEAVVGRAQDLDLDLPNARFYVGPCIAGHVGADTTAAMLAEGPHRGDSAVARRRRHQRRDRARRPTSPVRRVEPDRAGVRGRPDQLRAAGDRRGHRAGAHRPGHARAALPGDRLRAVERRSRIRRSDRRPPTSAASAARASSTSIAEMFLAGDHRRRRHDPRRAGGDTPHVSSPTAARSPTCSTSATAPG